MRPNFFLVLKSLNKKGIWQTIRHLLGIFLSPYSSRFLFRFFLRFPIKKKLGKILAENKGKSIIIFPHRYGWSTEVVGRFQHMSTQFAKKGFFK